MTLEEYIKMAKEELDKMKNKYLEENAKDPENWPLEREPGEWGEEEMCQRFA